MANISKISVGGVPFDIRDAEARTAIGDIGAVLDDILGGEPVAPGTVTVPLALPVCVTDGTREYAIGVADDADGTDLTVERT